MQYEWTRWTKWTGCSRTCGGYGVTKRTKKCIPPSRGGVECPDLKKEELRVCGMNECPGTEMKVKIPNSARCIIHEDTYFNL
jgi:hypothetical protein